MIFISTLSVRQKLRIVDVNLNRAREGLRVLEEQARFTYGAAALAGRVKELRHRVARVEAGFPGGRAALVEARDVAADPGASAWEGEFRDDPEGANFKRVQEALRVLEEQARCFDIHLAHDLKILRFAVYELERSYHAEGVQRPAAGLAAGGLYLIAGAGDTAGRPLLNAVRAAAAGGATVFQLREKDAPAGEFMARAREMRGLTRELGMLFIVNDRLDIALAAEADGVHLGQDDLPLAAARAIAGTGLIIGLSTHSLEQAVAAEKEGADYIGVGPVFPTSTKPDYRPVGLDLVRRVAEQVRIPFVAIGGINRQNTPDVLTAGARCLAVVRAVFGAPDINAATADLMAQIRRFKEGTSLDPDA